MERAAALTGPEGRPMIASGYEKAGAKGRTACARTAWENVHAHPGDCHSCRPEDGYACDGNPHALALGRLWLSFHSHSAVQWPVRV
jgi:hypothetical protein